MENRKESQEQHSNPIIIDGNEMIETSVEQVVVSQGIECGKENFYANVEKYKNGLSPRMREKTMITMPLYNNIINALKHTRGGKMIGIDSKFHLWCKKNIKIDYGAGTKVLCSSKNHNRIAVVESYYEVCSSAPVHTHLTIAILDIV